ncbi:MAG TPA: ferredoxin [Pseudonocardiaceae bacterium]|jgi:ferredoxin|nr:ferredoxin [Pseudonocardiaceae bacterium]
MTVIIDQDRRVGAGQCVLSAPEVFDQREEEDTVVLPRQRPRARLGDTVHQAARRCPGLAIQLDES